MSMLRCGLATCLALLVGCADAELAELPDGLSDAELGSCGGRSLGFPFTGSTPLEICNDGIDNDCDGLTDSFDPDCSGTGFIIGTLGNDLLPPMPWDLVEETFDELGVDAGDGFWAFGPDDGIDGNGDGTPDAYFGNIEVAFAIDGRRFEGYLEAFGGDSDPIEVIDTDEDPPEVATAFTTSSGKAPTRETRVITDRETTTGTISGTR